MVMIVVFQIINRSTTAVQYCGVNPEHVHYVAEDADGDTQIQLQHPSWICVHGSVQDVVAQLNGHTAEN